MTNQRNQGPRCPSEMASDGREEMRWSVVEQIVRRGTLTQLATDRRRPAATTMFRAEARPKSRRSTGPVPLSRTICSTTPQRRFRHAGFAGCAPLQFSTSGRTAALALRIAVLPDPDAAGAADGGDGAVVEQRNWGPRTRHPAGMAGDGRKELRWRVVEQTVRRGTSFKHFKQRSSPAATTTFRAEARPRSRRSVGPVPLYRTICSTTPQRRFRHACSAGCALLQFSTSGRIRRGPFRAGWR